MKKIKNRTPLILIFLAMLILGVYNQVPDLYGEPKETILETYPQTPEAVVEAFCREDFGRNGDYWKMLQKYTLWKDAPGWDITNLVVGYSVRKIRENHRSAQVLVEYKMIGEYYWDDIGPVFKEIIKKKSLLFKLIKKENLWKIESPQEPPYFNVEIVINDLEKALKEPIGLKRKTRIEQVLKDIRNSLGKF